MKSTRLINLALLAICWSMILLMQTNFVISRHCVDRGRQNEDACYDKAVFAGVAAVESCYATIVDRHEHCWPDNPLHLWPWYWTYEGRP